MQLAGVRNVKVARAVLSDTVATLTRSRKPSRSRS
jgi:hypothetical protein